MTIYRLYEGWYIANGLVGGIRIFGSGRTHVEALMSALKDYQKSLSLRIK